MKMSQAGGGRKATYVLESKESIGAVIAQRTGVLEHFLERSDFWGRFLNHLPLVDDIVGRRLRERPG